MKILITGCTGMLGTSLILENTQHETCGIYLGQKPRYSQAFEVDISNEIETGLIISKMKPDAIIHTAALTNVDLCEKDIELAYNVHVKGTENLVRAAKKNNSYFLYISTDSVFDGKIGNYSESDLVNPLNMYAKTKYEGELKVLEYEKSAIARTNIYGWNWLSKASIAEWILQSLREKKPLNLFRDVFFTPILTNNLAKILFEMCEKEIRGLYHVTGSESVSKLNFGLQLAKIFNLDVGSIQSVSISEVGLKAKRPLNPTLKCTKIEENLKRKMPSVAEGLKKFKELEDHHYLERLKVF